MLLEEEGDAPNLDAGAVQVDVRVPSDRPVHVLNADACEAGMEQRGIGRPPERDELGVLEGGVRFERIGVEAEEVAARDEDPLRVDLLQCRVGTRALAQRPCVVAADVGRTEHAVPDRSCQQHARPARSRLSTPIVRAARPAASTARGTRERSSR